MNPNTEIPITDDSSPSTCLPAPRWANFLLLGNCLFALWAFLLWLLPHWDYLPDWAPVPGPIVMDIVKCLQPVILCFVGLPTLLVLLVGLFANLGLLFRRLLARGFREVVKMGIAVTILFAVCLLWLLGDAIDQANLSYGIARYDVVIDAIERYLDDHGRYPPTLDDLVPGYLATVPGIYMKFGQTLEYEPNPPAWYDHAPFAFELGGSHMGIHGQTLKYCPVEFEPCYEDDRKHTSRRIDDRWIWVYSSAL